MQNRITIICGVMILDGAIATSTEREWVNRRVERGELVERKYGGVVWFERPRDNETLKVAEVRMTRNGKKIGRPRGEKFGKHVKQPGIGRGNNSRPIPYRHPVPDEVIIKLKVELGLSGSQCAKWLHSNGYGKVSKSFANRRINEVGVLPNSQQRGGRPQKGVR